jgi:hypothetical protein
MSQFSYQHMDNYSREEGFTYYSIVTVFNNEVFHDHSTKKNPKIGLFH